MNRKFFWTALAALTLTLAACTQAQPATSPPAEPTQDPNAVTTSVAQTVEAELTQVAAAAPTDTPVPTPTNPPPAATPTDQTTPPTETPLPQPPTPTVEAAFELHAQFVADVTIPDGTPIVAGETFSKTWRIRNIGSQTWTTDYAFVFINGDRMEGQAINLPAEVPPGGEIDITIPMIAPDEPGTYIGYWMLQTPDTGPNDGALFGLGDNADQALYVEIQVIPPTPTPTHTPTPTATPEGGSETPTATPTPESQGVLLVALTVDTNAYLGACPANLTFTATLTLSGPLSLDYQVEALPDDPGYTFTDLPAGSLDSAQQGTHTVTIPFTLPVDATLSGQVTFRVTTPNDISSPPVVFSVTCEG